MLFSLIGILFDLIIIFILFMIAGILFLLITLFIGVLISIIKEKPNWASKLYKKLMS